MKVEESREEYLTCFQKQNNCELPYCIEVKGDREGPHVVVVGGTHGNEPAGVEAMIAFQQQVKCGEAKLARGKVSLLLGNPEAYRKDQRYVDKDLNRSFDDPVHTTIEGRRAAEILRYLDRSHDVTALLDLHSVSIGDFKICVYEKENDQSLELALSITDISMHFAYHAAHMPGALITAGSRRHICGLIVECGNHLSPEAAKTALDHIRAILLHKNVIDALFRPEKRMPEAIIQYESIQPIKPGPNFRFLIPDVATGTKLVKGQVFGQDDNGDHIALQDCYVVVPSRIVKSTDDDAGFLGWLNQIRFSSTPWQAT